MGDNGPVSSMRAELQQMVVEAVVWRVTSNQKHSGVSAYSQSVARHRGQHYALLEMEEHFIC